MRFDVAVIGGGPAGSLCAARLADLGLYVALIAGPRRRSSWLELLAPEAVLALLGMGLLPPDDRSVWRACPGVIDTWGADSPVVSDFELMRCSPGWVVDRERFDALLLEFARSRGVHVLPSATSAPTADVASDPVVLESAGGRVEAGFVVDASGISGRVVPNCYSRRRWYDGLVAVRAIAPRTLPHSEWMHLGSSSAGWWYVLPDVGGLVQAVFMTDGDLLPRTGGLPAHLEAQFVEAFGASLGLGANGEQSLELRDARTSCRLTLWARRWMPVGDSAFAIDPLSGGGMTRSLRMAEETANVVAGFVSTGQFDGLQQLAVRRAAAVASLCEDLQTRYRHNDKFRHTDVPFWARRRTL